ncbi:MAG TPA: peptidoglycan DD-metalloendopeptidase family protein [Flavisolibacter sp.]
MKKLLLFIGLFSGLVLQAQQDKAQLERERQQIQQELKEYQSQYNRVKGQKKASLGQLHLIQKKVETQGRYIGNINKEIGTINDEIYLSNLEIYRLQIQLDTLKSQYARSVVYAYKNNSNYDYLNFIFSASSFNDALKRMEYLKSYRAYRQQQMNSIQETQQMIRDRKQQLLTKQSRKKAALQNQQQQLAILEDQKREKDNVVAKLKSQEKELSKEIAAKRKRDSQLKNQIAAVVRREIEAARKEAERREAERRRADAEAGRTASPGTTTSTAGTVTKPAASKPKSYLNLNAADIALNNSFEKNRGSLPWPVDNGYVSIPFGTSKVGGLTFDNAGISISTPSAGTPVKAVFDGEVSSVSDLGDGMMVMIRHGKYFTVYSNMSSVSVSKGATVKTGQVIGRTATADDGTGGQLDLILMNERQNVNPTPWLRR